MPEVARRNPFPGFSTVRAGLRMPLIRGAIIALVCLAAYSNSFRVPFQFDDIINIMEKPFVRDIRLFFDSGGERPFPFDGSFRVRKIGFFTLALNYRLGGEQVFGYHVFNVAVHCINAFLVYWIVVLGFRTPVLRNTSLRNSSDTIALFSALLFASHPVQTQAVTYIVQRLTSLATLFYLLSPAAYVKARIVRSEGNTWSRALPWHAGSLLSAIAAMHTKEIAFTLPVMIAVYELMFFEGALRKRIHALAPLLLTMPIVPYYLLAGSEGTGGLLGMADAATRVGGSMSRWEYLATQFRVIVTYVRLLFYPAGQNLDYDYRLFRSFFEWEVMLSFAFLSGIAALAVYLARRDRSAKTGATIISYGIIWFFVALSVESSVIPIVDVINEHRVYLPSAWFFIALASSAFLIAQRTGKETVHRACIALLAGAVLAFSCLTFARNEVWRDGLTLWADVVKKSPGKARGHANLGVELRKNGRAGEAMEHHLIAIRLEPDYAYAYNNLGLAYNDLGLRDEAVAQYETAIRLKPDFVEAYNNLGIVYWEKGMLRDAVQQYLKAISLDAGLAEAHTNLGVVYRQLGLIDQALAEFRIAIFLRPDLADPYNNIGVIYANMGMTDKAIEHFERAVRIRPDRLDYRQNRDKAYAARFGR